MCFLLDMREDEDTTTGHRRRGRPPAPPDRVRPCRLVTFVTHAEKAQLRRMSEAEGKSISALAHEILSRSLRRRRRLQDPSSDDGGLNE
jgi:hypothetical protein